MPIAPVPGFPEKPTYAYARKLDSERRYSRGPLRFMEGVAQDTDVPNDFVKGAVSDVAAQSAYCADANPLSQFKFPEETMRERLHVGSASWVEAQSQLSEFANEAFAPYDRPEYGRAFNTGGRVARVEPTVVND